jgi:hypothetical protein
MCFYFWERNEDYEDPERFETIAPRSTHLQNGNDRKQVATIRHGVLLEKSVLRLGARPSVGRTPGQHRSTRLACTVLRVLMCDIAHATDTCSVGDPRSLNVRGRTDYFSLTS